MMRGATRFLRDEKGAMTVEFVTLVPVFIMMLLFFADASVVWLTHSEMYNAARDVSRRMTTGQIEDQADVKSFAANSLFLSGRNYIIDADFGADMRVVIAVPVRSAAFFGKWFEPAIGTSLVATAVTRQEPPLIEEDLTPNIGGGGG